MFDFFQVFVDALSAPASDEPDSPYARYCECEYLVPNPTHRGLEARANIVAHLEDVFKDPPSDAIPNLFSTFSHYIQQEDPLGTFSLYTST